jgi:type VI secretion system secreted protein VgrG
MNEPSSPLPEVRWSFSAGRVTPDAWYVVNLDAREAMSEVYRARVVLIMESGGGGLDELLGKPALLTTARGGLTRDLKGVVAEVEELGTTAQHRFVRVEVVPSLWLLSQRSDCRIFQEKNTAAIVRAVLASAGVYRGPGELVIDGALDAMAPREYTVQYQESDLDFIRRLLEDDGIPFYFKHDGEAGETFVLAGDEHAWAKVATLDGGAIHAMETGTLTASTEGFQWFDERHALRPSSVTLRDFDFTRPRAKLDMTARHGQGSRALYEYPARSTITAYDRGAHAYKTHNTARLAKLRAEEHQTRMHRGHGDSYVTGMMPGLRFSLAGHERPELDRAYLVTAVDHSGHDWNAIPEEVRASRRFKKLLRGAGIHGPDAEHGEERYNNRVEVHRVDDNPASVPVRPARVTPRPLVEGPQTARVVGPAGEEIHTDEHGRIKVQFHWDREGHENQDSSCWIRVAQNMSGGNWGFVFIPRIGMEVVVNFLEGDPDRPLVTGCVYNGENTPPYSLPAHKTRTTIKTWTSPQDGGYNEIRFEDAKGAEQVYVQAQRDMDTLVKHDETLTVQRHRTKHVMGEEFNTIDKNRITQVHENDSTTIDQNKTLEVFQSSQESVSQNKSVQVGQTYSINAGMRFEITCGASRLSMDAAGNVTLQGVKLAIQGTGDDSHVDVDAKLIDLN